MSTFEKIHIDWQKMKDLVPAIIQNEKTGEVLMLGYMNQQSLRKTLETGLVTFYSRSRKTLWTKGETSGNVLKFKSLAADCDQDSLLVFVEPQGPTCHLGVASCFEQENLKDWQLISRLTEIIEDRKKHPTEKSYTAELLKSGVARIAQKVGEEGVEVALAAVTSDVSHLAEESSDLVFHLLVLLSACELPWSNVLEIIRARMKKYDLR